MARRTTNRRTTSYSTTRRSSRAAADPINLRPWLVGGAGVLLLGGLLLWYMLNGGWNRMVDSLYDLTAHAGLKVEEVFITGRTNLNRDELLATINVDRGDPILAIDIADVYERITSNAWIASARVERHLPNVLYIALVERTPFARWQHNNKLRLIDDTGVVLSEADEDLTRFSSLPLVVGDGAPKAAAAMLTVLRDFPDFRQNMEALVRVGDRRWDMRLSNGITIKLPDGDPAGAGAAALERVQGVWAAAEFNGKNVKVIDARMSDRLVIDNADKDANEPEKKATP